MQAGGGRRVQFVSVDNGQRRAVQCQCVDPGIPRPMSRLRARHTYQPTRYRPGSGETICPARVLYDNADQLVFQHRVSY